MSENLVTINSRKYDGRIHRSWKAKLIAETIEMLSFAGAFEFEVNHPDLGVIRRNTVSFEYYWKNKWFSIFRFHEPDGELRNFYCNINQPPTFANNILDFVDLDLDILVNRDLTYRVLDQEEFIQNSEKYFYSREIIEKTRESLEYLKEMIRKRDFPFDLSDSPVIVETEPNPFLDSKEQQN